ncbi:MAG: GNAT family N-acetyltransferase [Paracoccaceae bacterium]
MIRDATPADEAGWRILWHGFLDFYETDLDPNITSHTWTRLMDPASPMKMRVAEPDGALVAFAIRQHHPSTWVMGDDCYLEDLFVDPAARGQGLGRAMIQDLIDLARVKGWHRIYWHTDEGNATARKLYDSIMPRDGHIRYRMALK